MFRTKCRTTSPFGAALLCALAILVLKPLIAQAAAAADSFLQKADLELKKNNRPTDELLNQLGSYIEKEPKNYQAHFLLGMCYDRLGLVDEATREFDLATKYSHSDSGPITELIKEQMALGNDRTVEKLLKIAQTNFPDDPSVAFWSAQYLFLRKHDLYDSEKLYRIAAHSGKVIPGAHLGLARVALEKGRNWDAILEASQEMKVQPNTPLAALTAGMAFAKLGSFKAALLPLQMTYPTFKTLPEVATLYAQTAYWCGRYPEAIEPAIVQMALSSKRDPTTDDQPMKRLLTRCLRHTNSKLAESIIANTSYNLDHNQKIFKWPSFHRELADVLADVGMHRLAVQEYAKCIERDPRDANAVFRLGHEFELHFQDYKIALACYERAHALDENLPSADDYIERLQQRIADRDLDISWRTKDWLNRIANQIGTTIGALFDRFTQKPNTANQLQTSK